MVDKSHEFTSSILHTPTIWIKRVRAAASRVFSRLSRLRGNFHTKSPPSKHVWALLATLWSKFQITARSQMWSKFQITASTQHQTLVCITLKTVLLAYKLQDWLQCSVLWNGVAIWTLSRWIQSKLLVAKSLCASCYGANVHFTPSWAERTNVITMHNFLPLSCLLPWLWHIILGGLSRNGAGGRGTHPPAPILSSLRSLLPDFWSSLQLLDTTTPSTNRPLFG